MRTICRLLEAHVDLLVFVSGLGFLYMGVAGAWSASVANVVIGAVMMVTAAWPYLLRPSKGPRG